MFTADRLENSDEVGVFLGTPSIRTPQADWSIPVIRQNWACTASEIRSLIKPYCSERVGPAPRQADSPPTVGLSDYRNSGPSPETRQSAAPTLAVGLVMWFRCY